MYFVYPSRHLNNLDTALQVFCDLQVTQVADMADCDPHQICVADVHDFLQNPWDCPTVVIALEHEGWALSQAWQKGALAGWIWQDLPQQPSLELQHIEMRYKRDQDSRDLPSAANLQRCLLPDGLELNQYRFKQLFQPYAYLSGDWFDYWALDDGRVMFYLADVSGHGVASSLLTSWLAAFHGRAQSPLRLLEKLNRMLIQENIEKHITMISGCVNTLTHEVECYNAGHFPPAMLLSPYAEPQVLRSSSLPLGFTDELTTEKITFTMQPESRLVLCSDGALEPFSGGVNEQFEQLLNEIIKGNMQIPVQLNDDIAILSVTRLA